MKRIAILFIGVFVLTLFPVIPTQAAEFQANIGTVQRGQGGVFLSIDFNIQSTAKGTGIRYRTEEITVRFGGKSVTFTHDDLVAHNFYNSSTSNVMSFTVADFAAKGISAEELQSHAQTSNFAIEPTIIVTNDGTPIAGAVAKNTTDMYKLIDKYFPGQTAIKTALESRWGLTADPDRPPERPNLTATIKIVDSSDDAVNYLKAGDQYTIKGIFTNNSNLNCEDANIRAYFQGKDDADLQALTPYTDSISSGQSVLKNWTFTATEGVNLLSVSINRAYQGYGGYYNEKFFSGEKEYDESSWEDNWADIDYYASSPSKSGGGSSSSVVDNSPSAYDLAGVSGQIVDAQGQATSVANTNQAYNIQTTFRSDFTVGGFAKLRLYRVDNGLTLLDSIGVYFEPGPNKKLTYTWRGINVRNGDNRFYATIDISEDGTHELFDGKYEETRWNNNSVTISTSGTEAIVVPETPPVYSSSFSFPVWEPAHEEIRVTHKKVPIYGWKEVKCNAPPKPKIYIRLVPNSDD